MTHSLAGLALSGGCGRRPIRSDVSKSCWIRVGENDDNDDEEVSPKDDSTGLPSMMVEYL